jgi:hypothetical protein
VKLAEGTFERVSPASFAERVELPSGWMVLRHSHVKGKGLRRETHGHWVAVICEGRTIYRVLRYSIDLPKTKIVLDWAGWIDLQGRIADAPDKLSLVVREPHLLERVVIPFKHIDPGFRMAAWMASISLLLGALSVAISLCS